MKKNYVVLNACFHPSDKNGKLLKQGDSVHLDESDAKRLVTFGRLRLGEEAADDHEKSSEDSDGGKPKKPKRGRSNSAADGSLVDDSDNNPTREGRSDDSTESEEE